MATEVTTPRQAAATASTSQSPPTRSWVPAPTTNPSQEPELPCGPAGAEAPAACARGLGPRRAPLGVKDAGARDGEPRTEQARGEPHCMILASTHRRRAKWLRQPPGCAEPASRGAGILPSFVNSRRSAPPQPADVQLGGGQPGSGSASQSAPLLSSPRPSSVPLSEPALTQLP